MQTSIKQNLISSIGILFEVSKGCKLEAAIFQKQNKELTIISDYFGVTKSQSLFVAIIFALNYKGDIVVLETLIDFFDCNPMKILEFDDDLNALHSLGIVTKSKSSNRRKIISRDDDFTINKIVIEAILQNKPMPEIKKEEVIDVYAFLEQLYKLGEKRIEDECSTHALLRESKALIKANLHYPLIHKIDLLRLDISDTFLYLYLIWKTICGKESTDIGVALEGICDDTSKRMNYMQNLINGENQLIKFNLIEIVEAPFFNDFDMKLTTKSNKLIADCGIKLFLDNKKRDNVLLPKEIPFRALLFSESEMEQLFLLKDLLSETKFLETQTRLTDKNLSKGINVLLHGAPGTGKTEIVKQIAKETNREIMKVDISQSKSMWFGESEKVIKKVFTDYKSFAEESEQTPILFFNEADAIISKRVEGRDSSTSKTENAIQNILLEELENFEGILIATTNLVNNLDAAFERRFLFKIQFNKPDVSIRAKIWESKFPTLSINDCKVLAETFDFSGGQIDNILRKKEIHEIIHGGNTALSKLMSFCSEETLLSHRVKIGFTKKAC